MSILDTLNTLSSAEEFFDALDVPFDPAVVRVARLHIMRRMGQYIRCEDFGDLDDSGVKDSCRSCLETAYQDFVKSSPIEERVFKVHQEAIQPKEDVVPVKPFVPLSSLAVIGK